MKTKYILIFFLTIQNFICYSQTFEVIDSITIKKDNILNGQWADINNDGTLEYIALLTDKDSINVGVFTINNGSLNFNIIISKLCSDAQFMVEDFSHDGLLDILISTSSNSGNKLELYVNNESLGFGDEIVEIDSVFTHQFITVDINRDGLSEIIAITEDINKTFETKIYTYTNTKWDTLSHDVSDFITADILSIDVDKDGWQDLLIGGKTTLGETVLEFYKNNKDSLILESNTFDYPVELKMTKADIDADGDFDLFFHGDPEQHSPISYYENTGGQFKKVDLMIESDSVSYLFAADLNSDGFCDIALNTHSPINERNIIKFNNDSLNFSTEDFINASFQDFGDWDWDGDLDLIQISSNADTLKVKLFENTIPESNVGPANVSVSRVFPMFNDVVLHWQPVVDDHTPDAAITYDLYLKSNELVLSPSFEIDHVFRTLRAHGNQFTLTQALYYDLQPGVYEYGIETVDNAFYALGCKGWGSGGEGGGEDIHRGKFVICEEVLTYEHTVCQNEEVILLSPNGQLGDWYSSLYGYIGIADSLLVTINEDVNIFFSMNNSLNCSDQIAWVFTIGDGVVVNDPSSFWACKEEILEFDVGSFWKTVQWESSTSGSLGDESNINYVVQQVDTLSVTKESFQGCVFTDTFVINISQPLLSLNSNVHKILKGESVQLIANGGVTYSWFPIDYLNDSTINNPIATPEITTTYVVNATDSIGCMSSDSVLVIIETKAFIPNLFTPNRDGKNDVLKIYGLEDVAEFSFKIFNRSGSLVFESDSETEVVNIGWDGSWKGKSQPNGVYYWKVSGTYKNGYSITLNGENSGAIHLLK